MRALLLLSLGVVLVAPAQAQLSRPARPGADSLERVRLDSIARADSVSGELPRAEVPVLTEVGMTHRWNRDSLFSTGALTLADFLDRVPGLSTLRARYYMAPQVGSYNGDVSRVRLFLDGVELDPIDPRSGGVTDLSLFPVAALEELVVERGANELRLHMRSWRGPLRKSAQTRADVNTGDNRSNTFRGFWARRTSNGLAFQAMLQQRSTDDRRLGGDGDATTVFARVGYVRPGWTLDGTLLRVRSAQQSLSVIDAASFEFGRAIPRYDQVLTDAYLRFAAGSQARGGWMQIVAATRSDRENSPVRAASTALAFLADSADTTRSSRQLVATAGWSTPTLRLSVTERLRRVDGATLHQPSVRIGIDLGRVTLAAYGERRPFDEVTRVDVSARFQPVARVALTGAASYGTTGSITLQTDSTPGYALVPLSAAKAVRAEAAIRIGKLWVQGGAVVRGATVLRAPLLFDRTTVPVNDARVTGATYTVIGDVLPSVSIHASGVRWTQGGWYRPQTEARTELTWMYRWRNKDPNGGFDFRLTGVAEYRSRSLVPKLRDSTGALLALPTYAAAPLGLRAEFTLRDATVFVHARNILGTPYTTVPGLLMPAALTVYGVRWSFWN